jgi:hypothetical protein
LPKLRGDFYEPSYVYFKDFPIRALNFDNKSDVARHDKMVSFVEQMLEAKKKLAAATSEGDRNFLTRKCENLDMQIDALVYELYGLSKEEIALIEA